MIIDNKYELKDEVYLRTDSDQKKRIVICIQVSVGVILYKLACGIEETWHYDFEIAETRDFTLTG